MTANQLTFHEAAELIKDWRKPLLISHVKPDGDALGALIAMHAILCELGSSPHAVRFDPIPPRYQWLIAEQPLSEWSNESDADAVIILDTCARSQLEPIMQWLDDNQRPSLAVDHHVTRDDIVTHELVDTSASATCLILHEWVKEMAWRVPAHAVDALFTGIATDTGWFKHSNTDARTLIAASELIQQGAQTNRIHQCLYQTDSVAKFRLWSEALAGTQFHFDNRLAVTTMTNMLLQKTGAMPADTEDLINEPLKIADVLLSILITEQPSGPLKISFRSKHTIDVAKWAAAHGGGGHMRAAGAKMDTPLDDAVVRIVAEAQTKLIHMK
jgi:phosphoesterase RecJ-like protein